MSAGHDNNSQPIKTAFDGNIKQNHIVIKAEIGEAEWRAAKRYLWSQAYLAATIK